MEVSRSCLPSEKYTVQASQLLDTNFDASDAVGMHGCQLWSISLSHVQHMTVCSSYAVQVGPQLMGLGAGVHLPLLL